MQNPKMVPAKTKRRIALREATVAFSAAVAATKQRQAKRLVEKTRAHKPRKPIDPMTISNTELMGVVAALRVQAKNHISNIKHREGTADEEMARAMQKCANLLEDIVHVRIGQAHPITEPVRRKRVVK